MKVAKVRFTAGSRFHTHTVPGTRNSYTFQHYTHDVYWAPVESIEDAAYFDEHESFAVEWTPAGLLARATSGAAGTVKEALKTLDYRDKQKIAKKRGIKANQSEEELNEELNEAAEELAQQLQHQR
jgi:hypothetical protein